MLKTSCLYLSYFLCKKQLSKPLKTVDPVRYPLERFPENRVYLTVSTGKTMTGRDTYVTDMLKNDLT